MKDLGEPISNSEQGVDDTSFDDYDQMKRFLTSIKKGTKLQRKDISQEGDHSGPSLDQTPERVEFNEDENGPIALEMIQEETEQDTTKQKESDLISPDKLKSSSERNYKAQDLTELSEERVENYKTNEKPEDYEISEELQSKIKEELTQKLLNSAYSSMSSYKTNLINSLELNKRNEYC